MCASHTAPKPVSRPVPDSRIAATSGMKPICTGTISSATMIRKIVSRNGNLIHASAKAAIDAMTSGMSVDGIVIQRLLRNASPIPSDR